MGLPIPIPRWFVDVRLVSLLRLVVICVSLTCVFPFLLFSYLGVDDTGCFDRWPRWETIPIFASNLSIHFHLKLFSIALIAHNVDLLRLLRVPPHSFCSS